MQISFFAIILGFILVLLTLFILYATNINSSKELVSMKNTTKVKTISPESMKAWIDAGFVNDAKTPIILIDVRTPKEHAAKHIPGDILLPVDTIATTIHQKVSDKNTPIVVYCRSGARSDQAAIELITLGYTDVTNLGGIMS